MAVKFLTKVSYNDIYQITTSNGSNVKVSISAKLDNNNSKIWIAQVYNVQLGEWKYFMSEHENVCGSFDNFLKKLDIIFRDD